VWWTSEHDDLLMNQISRWHWVWYWTITDEIIKLTSEITLEAWKAADPLCSIYSWYNILMYFAASRAEQLGFTKAIRPAKKKNCLLCKKDFIEDSLPMPLIERLGIDRLNFCAPCLRDTVLQGTGNDSASENEIKEYLQDLSNLIGRVPPQNYGEGMSDLLDLEDSERLALLHLLKKKPHVRCVKSRYGSWLNALIQAGILGDGTRHTSRGIQSLAKDGHVCLSLGEKTIDDYLYRHGICHEKEPKYPEGNYRGDFKVGDTIIEYFSLTGNPEYDGKTKQKIQICKKNKISLMAIYPQDLVSPEKLKRKLSVFFTYGNSQRA
jgi:hypothetical protein